VSHDFTAELATLAPLGLLPVVAVHSAPQTDALIAALVENGLPGVEIVLRTPYAATAMRRVVESGVAVAAGTARTPRDVEAAAAAGAAVVLSAGLSAPVADACDAADLPYVPGVATPTEVTAAWERGFRVMKFFPAEQAGGTARLKAFGGPFPDVRFVPTGGIREHNAADYLALPGVLAVGGTWMTEFGSDGEADAVRLHERVRRAVAALRGVPA
jgi:2-dehydro-3-deoxyphosphogluconate aldolase/(4S)-4-hydroxy-2-oxoglutarate aldolase